MQNSLSSLARVSLWTALLTLLVSGCAPATATFKGTAGDAGGGAGPGTGSEEPPPTSKTTPETGKVTKAPSTADGDAPTALTVEQLDKAADAKEKYAGKMVELTGKVARPGRVEPIKDGIEVMLTADGSRAAVLGASTSVFAVFPLQGSDATRTLAPTQTVQLKGELRQVDTKMWELVKAELVSAGEDPSKPVTASDLTKAFVDDQEAAAKMFAKQPLKVTGKVTGMPTVAGKFLAIALEGARKGDKPTAVLVLLDPAHFAKYGQPVPSANDLKGQPLYPAGTEVSFQGMLQLPEMTDAPDGTPAVWLEAYPVKWPG